MVDDNRRPVALVDVTQDLVEAIGAKEALELGLNDAWCALTEALKERPDYVPVEYSIRLTARSAEHREHDLKEAEQWYGKLPKKAATE